MTLRDLPYFKRTAAHFKQMGAFVSRTFEGKSTGEFVSEASVKRRKKLARYLYNVLFALTVAAIFTVPGPHSRPGTLPKPGEIAETDVISPVSSEVETSETPSLHRRAMSRRVPPVYDYDETIHEKWLRDWQSAFKAVRDKHYSGRKTPLLKAEYLDTLRQELYDLTEQTLLPEHLQYFHKHRFSTALEKSFTSSADKLSNRMISASDLLASHSSTGIILRHVNNAPKEVILQDLSRVWSLEQAQEYLLSSPKGKKQGQSLGSRQMAQVVGTLIPPNLQFNATLSQRRVEMLLATEKAPTSKLKTGQVLVRRGQRVTEQQANLLEAMTELMKPQSLAKRFLLASILLLIFFSVLFRTNYLGRGFWYLSLKDCMFFFVVTVITLIGIKISVPYLKIIFASFGVTSGVEYLLPLSTGGLIIHLLMGKEAGHTFGLLISIISSFLLEQDLSYTVWSFAVIASAIQSIRSCKQRTDLYKCGAWSGAISSLTVLSFGLLQSLGLRQPEWFDLTITTILAFFSGFLSAIFTGILIPILESVAGYTTSLKLLELSNFNHPLLHSLMMKAPGTYHHSIIVGSLAELAADRVNANGLLARVSAYYHDIGKMGKPLYFIENQSPHNNPHDHLAPTMSAKILFSHVKNGVRLGREHNLGKSINDIIEQHHGTTLVSYFYNKAKTNENPEVDPASEADFRYPGPRPRSREAAIVMLADACEAATRSINDPTPAKIQGMVRSIINRRFLDEQFHECDLTFHDLQVIEDNFVRTLVSLYHHRIEYPGQKKQLDSAVQQVVNSNSSN